jgi:NADPH-dependent glutamate synthase beta subunit-like oxidoreductase
MSDAHVVAIVGGACAGSTAAQILAEDGMQVVVFEQNPKPYGKIEDGLPRWHKIQRRKEYEKINSRLNHPNVTYVPNTRLGEDIGFDELTTEWGFSAVLLANGAWGDRPVGVEGIDDYIDKGLIYQNPFIYWFNHKNEKAFDGPRYEIPQNTAVLGGGLASIDVVKAVQVECYERALKERGIECDMYELEHHGITAYCDSKEIDPEELGVQDCVLYYRRRNFDMPLASPKDRSEEAVAKAEQVRAKILDNAMAKFRFTFEERHLTKEFIVEDDRLVGLVMQRTRVEGKKAIPLEGTELEVRHPLFISSIGSIPEPISGVEMNGAYYDFSDWDLGIYAPREGVFGVGNTVTGQGNIRLSMEHGKAVANHLVEQFKERDPLGEETVTAVMKRAKARQDAVGYSGDYEAWIEKMTPADME